mmetsp:Transcript_9437/g.25635  ORF Transcript_9437/g.25635 Transcript_9437/m.25635 type:complete len:82 (+) Transcript_9437:189-434(+)|eukprot:CAMPEP_0198109928 /NCGR_PEP_ID=MMETSP1442-20131203/1959_1 /TAXON_ID= /ORGANISM="Craspedostauros australis, Strain CCMP3328" /LENGTH=81 /DNA_ID=CAMNT_0043765779 /DNA_START=207 /DNA_END=452 /DNA_ORIENTATION=-
MKPQVVSHRTGCGLSCWKVEIGTQPVHATSSSDFHNQLNHRPDLQLKPWRFHQPKSSPEVCPAQEDVQDIPHQRDDASPMP